MFVLKSFFYIVCLWVICRTDENSLNKETDDFGEGIINAKGYCAKIKQVPNNEIFEKYKIY